MSQFAFFIHLVTEFNSALGWQKMPMLDDFKVVSRPHDFFAAFVISAPDRQATGLQALSTAHTYIGDPFRACFGHAGRSPTFRFADA